MDIRKNVEFNRQKLNYYVYQIVNCVSIFIVRRLESKTFLLIEIEKGITTATLLSENTKKKRVHIILYIARGITCRNDAHDLSSEENHARTLKENYACDRHWVFSARGAEHTYVIA